MLTRGFKMGNAEDRTAKNLYRHCRYRADIARRSPVIFMAAPITNRIDGMPFVTEKLEQQATAKPPMSGRDPGCRCRRVLAPKRVLRRLPVAGVRS